MKHVYFLLLLLFSVLGSFGFYQDGRKVFLVSPRASFAMNEPIEMGLQLFSSTSLALPISCNLDIFDSSMNLVYSGRYEVGKNLMNIRVSLPDQCSPGYYLVNVYLSDADVNDADNLDQMLIYYGPDAMPIEQTPKRSFIVATPESERLLTNFTNRFIVQINDEDSLPVIRNFFVRNQKGLLIAKGKTNHSGTALVDIPNVSNDWYTITADHCEPVELSGFTDTGFAIQFKETDQLFVSILRAEREPLLNPIVKVYLDTVLISEAVLNFETDIGIVETAIDIPEIYGELLRFRLVSSTGDLLTQQYYWLNQQAERAATFIKRLNSSESAFSQSASRSFKIHFQTSIPPGESVSYQLLDSGKAIMGLGQVVVNRDGFLEILDCDFYGKASISFFVDRKYAKGSITTVSPLQWSNAFIRRASGYFSGRPVSFSKHPLSSAPENDTVKSSTGLRGVLVKGRIKSRNDEMEERYVSNGMFRSPISRDLIVEDDASAINYNNRFNEYLQKYIAGLQIVNNELKYRNGHVEVYVDESRWNDPPLSMSDIAYVKFIRGSLRGINSSKNTGTLSAGVAYDIGVTAYVAVYTKKYDPNGNNSTSRIELEVDGFRN